MDIWGEALPNWINAIATALAFVAAAVAALFAWQSLQRERRDARRQAAAGLAAWWIRRPVGSSEKWRVLILNTSDKVFTDIAIRTHGNNRAGVTPIAVSFLPPGRYFVESRTEGNPWGLKDVLGATEQPTPLLDSSRHRVDHVSYTDMTQNRWTWSPGSGLVELHRADSAATE